MPVMRGVTIILGAKDRARLRDALLLAMPLAALGRPARLFLQEEAVELLVGDDSGLLAEAMALGVVIHACQSGLAGAKFSAYDLPAGVETGGLIAILAAHGEDQIVLA